MKKLIWIAIAATLPCTVTAQTAPSACGDSCHAEILAKASASSSQSSVNGLAANVAQLQTGMTSVQQSIVQLKEQVTALSLKSESYFTIAGDHLGSCDNGAQDVSFQQLSQCRKGAEDIFCGRFNAGGVTYKTIGLVRNGLEVKAVTCWRQ